MPLLYPAPHTVAVNTVDGYIIHPVTGDSIQPIVNSKGDLVKTGVPVPAKGKQIFRENVAKPTTVPAGPPGIVLPSLNVKRIPETIPVIPVNKNSLKTFTPGVDTTSFVLVNSIGDTIATGVPRPIAGKEIPYTHPQPVQALPPRMKDNARINMNYLNVDQGMNSSHVLALLEDRQGNLWFGTGGGGVSIYNGETFTHFTDKEGLISNLVWSILQDSRGNFWFGTYGGGIRLYDGESMTLFTEKEGLSDNHIRCIQEDSNGNLWFGTWMGGVSKYNGETITHFSVKEGLGDNAVWSILEDSHGNIWFGTNGGGVSMYDGNTFTQFTEKEGLVNNVVQSILEDSGGNLWFGTENGGVSRYDGDSFTNYTEKEGLCNNNVNSILEDRNGHIWFGTEYGGVCRYNGQSFTYFTEKEGLSDNNVNSIIEDSHGNLWFGTENGGVCRFNVESFTHFTENEGLINNIVNSIVEDNHGNLWFGTENDGLGMFNGETLYHFTEKEGLTNNSVNSICEDSRGNIWIGTEYGGVSKYDGKSFTHFTEKEGLCNNHVSIVYEDSHGNLWFGTTRNGVSKYDGESFTHFTENEGLSLNHIRSILEDSRGNLWFGTYGGGVTRYDGSSFMHFTEKEGLTNNNVLSILEDSNGSLWFGTYGGGVTRYDGETFTHFTEREGLSNNIVQSLVEDLKGNIWVSTEKGLNRISPGPNPVMGSSPHPTIHTYGMEDGLKAMDFILNSGSIDSNNRIWWGSSNSLVMLDMDNFQYPDEQIAIQLNRIEINEMFLDYRLLIDSDETGIEFDGVVKYCNYPLNLELPFNKNHITFHFSAIDWTSPHKIMYSYKMEGLDHNWSHPTTEAKADYRSLPHGTYTFNVRAIGGAQNWSESFKYTFTIKPPWWHTLWARMIYGLAALLAIYGFARWRTVKLKQRQIELEAEVDQAISITREQKEEIEAQRDEVMATNEALENQKRELELTVENLKLTQSQLIQSEKMASIGLLTAGIAHELNNPINFVSGNVGPLARDLEELFSLINKYDEIIRDGKLQDMFLEIENMKNEIDFSFLVKEVVNLLNGIEEGANRSSQIVKGLRSFSRLDEEKIQFYDIHEGIDSTLTLLTNKIKNRITVRKEYGDIKGLECYPSKLNQVIMNILNNSIQAIEDKGEIFIQTISSGIGIKIIIKDSGKGMTPEVQKHIFEPFFTTKEVGKGTGLGLSISFGIVEQHNGNIDVISEPGKGTEFIVSLPHTQSE